MKIFKFNFEGYQDLILASDIDAAKVFYLDHTRCGDLEGYEVKEVPEDTWEQEFIIDPNEHVDIEDQECEDDYFEGYKITENLKEFAKGKTKAEFIASTDY